MNYIGSINNQSYYVNGNIYIDGMAASSNIYLHSKGNTTFTNNYLPTISKTYIEGDGKFQYFVISGSDLFTS